MATDGNRPHAWVLTSDESDSSSAEVRVWALSAGERLRRGLLRAGVASIESIGPNDAMPETTGPCIVVRDDLFYDERVTASLLAADGIVLLHALHDGEAPAALAASCDGAQLADVVAAMRSSGTGPVPSGLSATSLFELVPPYDPKLRKSADPFVFPARGADLRDIENRIFAAAYKGITDLITKWVFPLPARGVVRVLARAGVRPNAVTTVSYVLAIAVTWLFWEGQFGLGLALGWLMTFLDTVDGKLARCTLTSTPFGNVFDHGLDLIHPPFWWAAWAMALPGGFAEHSLAFWIVTVGYVVGRLLELAFTRSFEIQFFEWRRFDGYFRQVIARRNPNMILLSMGAIAGAPAWGLNAVAVWTVVCILISAVRNVQARIESSRGVEIRSWLDEPGSAS